MKFKELTETILDKRRASNQAISTQAKHFDKNGTADRLTKVAYREYISTLHSNITNLIKASREMYSKIESLEKTPEMEVFLNKVDDICDGKR